MHNPKDKKNGIIILILALLLVLGSILYLFWNTMGDVQFALMLRGNRIPVFLLVGTSVTVATIVFQTITHNTILSPNIIGLGSMYSLFQTMTIFIFGAGSFVVQDSLTNFLLSTLLMIVGSLVLFWIFFKKYPGKLFLLLMTGLIFGQLMNSLNTFFQAIIDPNEFETILSRSLVSFNDVDISLIIISFVVLIPILIYFFKNSNVIDVFHLGENYAINLGVNVSSTYLILFIFISVLTAISTALVGPITFLGFLGANLSYQLFKTYKHRWLFVGGSMLTILMLIFGQFILEHIFNNQTSINIVIEFVGGVYFLYMIMKERKRFG